jgi:tetratricopeptide (TPR) repeat protein
MQEIPPNTSDPIAMAAANSAGYTPEMHQEALERIRLQISQSNQHYRPTDSQYLDLYETAIYHAACSTSPTSALHLYDWDLGGYELFGGRLADYRRGLRITALLINVLGAEYMDLLACPAHDHNLYLLALGNPETAEQQTRHLLQHAREIAQEQPPRETWINPLRFVREDSNPGFVNYEVVWLQTWCDALLAQGKLGEAEAVMNEVLQQPHNWKRIGRKDKGRNGSNPYARRALARAWAGNVQGAFEDFDAADTFARNYTPAMIFRSRDWHHRALYAAFLARLGYLSGAQNILERLNTERIRLYRPLTTAELDLVLAEIAYARADDETAADCVNRVLVWADVSGHRQIHVRASLILAKLRLRAGDLEQAEELLNRVIADSEEAGFALQRLDALILLGYLRLANDDMESAEAAAREVETASEPLPYRWGMGDAAHLLARCAEARGDNEAALSHAERALFLRESLQDPKITHTRALIERLTSR